MKECDTAGRFEQPLVSTLVFTTRLRSYLAA